MTSLGTLSVDLELNGDGTFTTSIKSVDGVVKQLHGTADLATSSVNRLSTALQRHSASTLSTGLQGAASAANTLRASMTNLEAATRRSLDRMTEMQRQAASTAKEAERAAQAINRASRAQNTRPAASKPASTAPRTTTAPTGSPQSGFSAISGITGLASLTTGLGGALVAANLAMHGFEALKEQFIELVQAGDAYTQSVNRIEAVLGSTRTVATETYDALEEGAVQTGVDASELTRSFTNFQIALSGVGQSRQQIIGFTTTLSTLAHVSGTTSAAANRAFRELSEGLANGAVNLRQLKIVTQDMPPLTKALADSVHVTTGQLEEMAHEGKLTTEAVAQAVETMGERVNKQFNQMPVSLQAASQNMTTALDRLRAEIDQKLNLSQTIARFDQQIAHLAQSAARQMSSAPADRLATARAELAQLQELEDEGGTSITGINADPMAATSMNSATLKERIAATQSLIAQLEKQATAEKAADAASAATAKRQHEETEAADALRSAISHLGLSHEGSADDIRKLTSAVDSGHDAAVPYNGAMLKASQVLDMLREKATPAAEAIADLNKQLVEASARAQGGFQAALTAANLKADPTDESGQARNLTDAQRDALRSRLDAINAVQGEDAVRQATRRLALAQARQRDTTGFQAGRLQAGYDREDFIREHGDGTASRQEADQVYNSEISAARIEAMQRGAKAAGQATSAVSDLKAKLAELQASMTSGNTETAKWTAKLASANPALKAQSSTILALAKQIDAATAAQDRFNKAQQAIAALKGNVTQARSDASNAATELSEGPQLDFQRQLDRMRRQQADLVSAASAMSPAAGQQAQGLADQAYQTEALARLRDLVGANNLAAKQIGKSFDDTEAGRRSAALETVALEKRALTDAINAYVTSDQERRQLADATATYITARTKQAMRQTEGATAQLGRQWNDTTGMMDQATASFASSFTDTLASQLSSGKTSWKSYADSVIQEIERIMIKAALAPILQPLGNAIAGGASGSEGVFSSLGRFLGLTGSASTVTAADTGGEVGTSIGVGGFYHTGGIVGSEPTFFRGVDMSVFKRATRYHTGGIAGSEIPAILQRGEGVFTKGQMKAMGQAASGDKAVMSMADMVGSMVATQNQTAANKAASSTPPSLTMNFTNQSGTPMKAQTGTPKFDGESWVIDTVIKHASRPGNLRNTLASQK